MARILSSLVMIPVALAAIWFGGLWLGLGAALLASGMAWEWGHLIGVPSTGRASIVLVVIAGVSVLIAALSGSAAGVLAALLATLVAALIGGLAAPLWTWGGLLWVALPSIGFLYLRALEPGGRQTLFWLCAVVWATDIGAFVAGKTIGGPRLAPQISPHKTWAGLAGGMVAAAVVGLVAALFTAEGNALAMALGSAALAIVGQMGDMAESFAKRRFGAKDSSNLIPGHGGLLDRLDGMIAVVAVVGLITLMVGGSIVTWR